MRVENNLALNAQISNMRYNHINYNMLKSQPDSVSFSGTTIKSAKSFFKTIKNIIFAPFSALFKELEKIEAEEMLKIKARREAFKAIGKTP